MTVSQLIEILSGFPGDTSVRMELSPLNGSRRDVGEVGDILLILREPQHDHSLYLCGYIKEEGDSR
jgi:hypothetical protein